MDTKFKKGIVPWNKGTKGVMKINSGSFKKGMIALNRKEHINKTCPTCNNKFSVKPSLNRMTYCSRSCAKKGKPSPWKGRKASIETRKKQSIAKYGIRGENHPNWKGGYSEAYRLRRSVDYSNWRTSVFIRDNFTCKECGIKNVYVTAHHIKSFAKYPELRFDINNGLTLCEPCHMKTDNYKGRGKK